MRCSHPLLNVLPPVEIFSGVTSPGVFQLEAAAAPLEGGAGIRCPPEEHINTMLEVLAVLEKRMSLSFGRVAVTFTKPYYYYNLFSIQEPYFDFSPEW